MAIVNTHYGFCAKGGAAVKFTYTGEYNVRDDGVVELLTSGTIVFLEPTVIDVFMVGGGGHGGYTNGWLKNVGCGGGGGGYTRTIRKNTIAANTPINVTVGAGDTNVSTSGGSGGSSAFGNFTVQGGYSCELNSRDDYSRRAIKGANGGSGGAAGVASTSDGGAGGYNGGPGEDAPNASDKGGTGQETNTREFGEATGKLYGGGGGGGRVMISSTPIISIGGSGGGGAGGFQHGSARNPQQAPAAGGANTGGGGGGSAINNSENSPGYGASGGSGIVCFREAAELPELAGTWVLNERLYAPASEIDETISFQAKTETSELKQFSRCATSTYLEFVTSNNVVTSVYNFSTNTWINKYKYLVFPAGATASDEFRAWLANNATKQS